jgi:phosphoenolpyruvate carboxykinase (GTP)
MGSETTAAATGQVGVVRRDPMAMLPFCGYNMGDYFAHWLRLGRGLENPPAVLHVNWFRADERGRFVWPGFGENLRVLLWMIERVKGRGGAEETPIGLVPTESALDWDGLGLGPEERRLLLGVERGEWAAEVPEIRAFFERFGSHLPAELTRSLSALERELAKVAAQPGPGVPRGAAGTPPPPSQTAGLFSTRRWITGPPRPHGEMYNFHLFIDLRS